MTVSTELEAYVCDLFSELGRISVRRIMGGAAIYCDGVMFGLIDREEGVFLKAEGVLASALAAGGSDQFVYDKNGRLHRMGYWRMPEDGWDDRQEALVWATRSLDFARIAGGGDYAAAG